MPFKVKILILSIDQSLVSNHKRVKKYPHILFVEINVPIIIFELIRDVFHFLKKLF